jgi:DNA polymerase III delta prime subunit
MSHPNIPSAFSSAPRTPLEHFKLCFYAAVLRVIGRLAQSLGSLDAVFEQFPFLVGYSEELATFGMTRVASEDADDVWRGWLSAWECATTEHLPLRALRVSAQLDHQAITLLMSVGLLEEDTRFGFLFETMQATPGQHRPTAGLLSEWWRDADDKGTARINLRRLQELGLINVVNKDAPRIEWALQTPALLWDVLRGESRHQLAQWINYRAPVDLLSLDELLAPETIQQRLGRIPQLLASGEVQALIVRGPHHNGRHTLLGAVARELGGGTLEINWAGKADDERWRLVGPLATMLRAMPIISLDLAPGEAVELPNLNGYEGPLGIVIGKQGGVAGPCAERALALTLEMPDASTRRLHWLAGFGSREVKELDGICERFRMTGGNIRRAASLSIPYADLESRTAIKPVDVQQASRALNRQALDTLAAPVNTSGDWSHLAVSSQTLAELYSLESRCRNRERLRELVGEALGSQLNAGVRGLFSGPSGTGKTLAARLLASTLQMDLYRLDLSSIVSKYIGETEKALSQLFARAEELDVMLLLDEGDALLTQRTQVRDANDRYANLETNFLLQRLETFEGILIVTTNAADRIDSAFQRRMDVIVDFRPPDAAERWTIWQMHLPEVHAVAPSLLREVAARCTLTGGQIRNAVLHTSLLALSDGGIVTSSHLQSAVQREYRKMGAVCPLRHASTLAAVGE